MKPRFTRHSSGLIVAAVVASAGCGGSVDLGPGTPNDGGVASDGTPDHVYDCTMSFGSHAEANVSDVETLQFKSPTDATCSMATGCFVRTSSVAVAPGTAAEIVVGFQPFAPGTLNLEGNVPVGSVGATFWYSESDARGMRAWCAQSGKLTVTAVQSSGSTARLTFQTSGAAMAPTGDFAPNNMAHGVFSAELECTLSTVALSP